MISSPKNRWLKDIRRLRRSKDEGRLLLEGPHLLAEALDAGLELEATLATPEVLAAATADPESDEAQALGRLDRRPLEVEAALLDELADADSPRGLLAIARVRPLRLQDLEPSDGVFVFTDGLQDPGNLGALARVAEAAGARALLLGEGTCRKEHPRALRASAGSLLRLPTVQSVDVAAVDEALGSPSCVPRWPRWLALSPRGGTDLYCAGFDGRVVLAVGGEGPGLGDAVAERTDEFVTIPMQAGVESLNATVAAAVVLFEVARRRRTT